MDVVPALALLVIGVLLGGGACWFWLTSRFRVAAAEAARAATDATVNLRAEAAAIRAERASLLRRVEELSGTHAEAVDRLRRAEAEAAAATSALRAERDAA